MSQTFKEIMDEVSAKHPLTCNFEEDARYVWPAMWDDLYGRAQAAAPLPATAKVEMPGSCAECKAFCGVSASIKPSRKSDPCKANLFDHYAKKGV